MKVPITVMVEPETLIQLDSIAYRLTMNRSKTVRVLLEAYVVSLTQPERPWFMNRPKSDADKLHGAVEKSPALDGVHRT